MEDWSSVYHDLAPAMKQSGRNSRFITAFWAAVAAGFLAFGLWFIALPAALIAVWAFLTRNITAKKMPYAMKGALAEKKREYRRSSCDSGPDEEFYRYCIVFEPERAFSFNALGAADEMTQKIRRTSFFVPSEMFERFEEGKKECFVFLADGSIAGFVREGKMERIILADEWEKVPS